MTTLSIEHPEKTQRRLSDEARVSIIGIAISVVLSVVGAGVMTAFSAGTLRGDVNTHSAQISDLKTERADDKAHRDETLSLVLEELRHQREELRAIRERIDKIYERRR